VGLFSRKKKLTKEQCKELDKAREEIRKIAKTRDEEIEQLKDREEKRKQLKTKTITSGNPTRDFKKQRNFVKPPEDNLENLELQRRRQEEIETIERKIASDLRKKEEMFNAEISKLPQNNQEQTRKCSFSDCENRVDFFNGKQCKFCNNLYCFDHIQLENHDCIKTKHTKFLRKDWLRKYELDISTGLYVVVCDDCGFRSDIGRLIDTAGEERQNHISDRGCDQKKVFLEQWK